MTDNFEPMFSSIKGLSQRRRMPRLGKIRLGIKVKNAAGTVYPKEVPYFVVPPEVAAVYGEKPTILDIMFPVNSRAVVFPQALKYYGSSRGLKCIGDGEKAVRFSEDKHTQEEINCPCDLYEQKKCSQKGTLQVLLPKVSLAGVYQVDIGSTNSIVDCNSGIDYIAAQVEAATGIKGKFAWIPAVLKREPVETHHEGKKQTHYTLHVYGNFSINDLNIIKSDARVLTPPDYALPAPENLNPEMDDVKVYDEAEADKMSEPDHPAVPDDVKPDIPEPPKDVPVGAKADDSAYSDAEIKQFNIKKNRLVIEFQRVTHACVKQHKITEQDRMTATEILQERMQTLPWPERLEYLEKSVAEYKAKITTAEK